MKTPPISVITIYVVIAADGRHVAYESDQSAAEKQRETQGAERVEARPAIVLPDDLGVLMNPR